MTMYAKNIPAAPTQVYPYQKPQRGSGEFNFNSGKSGERTLSQEAVRQAEQLVQTSSSTNEDKLKG